MKKPLIFVVMLSTAILNCSKKTTTNNYYPAPGAGASIVGIVHPPESHALVMAYMGIPVASTYIDTNGYFKFSGLPAGTYWLLVQADRYNDYYSQANIRVTADQTALVDTIYLVSIYDLIASVRPQDGAQDVSVNEVIRITYRRDVDRESAEKAFQIEPGTPGEFDWYDGGKYGVEMYFRPSSGLLAISTRYQVTIDTTVSDASGVRPLKPFRFSFTTQAMGVASTYPSHKDAWVSPNTYVNVVFNTDMDVESVNSAFSMADSRQNYVAGNFYWGSGRYMYFYPHFSLLVKETYTVTIDTSASDTQGMKLSEPYRFSFTTQPIRISSTSPSSKETWVPAYINIRITFNTDMDIESVNSAFRMVDSGLNSVSGELMWQYPSQLYFDPHSDLTANQTYTVSIDTTARDMYGSKLESPYSFWFRTRP